MEDYTAQFKDILREIEELYIEETILTELSLNESEKIEPDHTKKIYKFYQKWQSLIETSQIVELVAFSRNIKTIFAASTPVLIEQLPENTFTEQETKQAVQPKEIEMMSRSTSKSEISTFGFKQEEIHVEERSSTVLTFSAQKYETHQTAETSRPEKPSKLEINVVNSPASASQPSSSSVSSQIPDSQSMAELNKNQQSSQVEFNMVLCEPAEFVKCIEKLIQSTQTVEKHLDNIQKPNKEFYEFEKQEIKLNAIKQTLESLAMALRTSLIHKRAILDKSNRETSKNITSSIQTLTRQHQNVVQKYKEKNSLHIQNYDKWHDFNKNFLKIQNWIDSTLVKLNELNETTLDTDKVQEIIKDFSNLTSYRLLLEKTYLSGNEILNKSNETDAQNLSDKLNDLNKKWKTLIALLNELKERALQSRSSSEQQSKADDLQGITAEEVNALEKLNRKIVEHNKWLSNCEELILREPSPVDELENERLIFDLSEFEKDLPFRQSMFENEFKIYSSQLKTSDECNLANQYSKSVLEKFERLNTSLPLKRKFLETNVEQLRGFLEELNTMNNWINSLHLDLLKKNTVQPSFSFSNKTPETPGSLKSPGSPSTSSQSPVTDAQSPNTPCSQFVLTPGTVYSYSNLVDSNSIKVVLNEKLNHLNDLKSIYATLNKESSKQMPESISQKMENLLSKWSQLEKSSDENLTSMSIYAGSLNQPTTQSITELKSPMSPTLSQPTVSNSIESVAFQAEKTISTNAIASTFTETKISKEKNQSSELNNAKALSKEIELSSQIKEISKEKSENFDQTFANIDTVQLEQSNLISLNNTQDLNSDEIKKPSSLILEDSVKAVPNMNTLANDEIEMISNDLFDWLLWIDHTLDSQIVTVDDLEEIQQSIQKYSSILSEVNKKQEQLEHLEKMIMSREDEPSNETPGTASKTISVKERLTQLSLQWKESTNRVIDKKQQLEIMLNESLKLEQINSDFLNRISDMEKKVQGLPEPSFGKDTLRKQKTEYKKTRSELNQIKQLFDELKEINEQMINKYQANDTSKVKLKYDRLLSRFNDLNNRLFLRGDNISDALQMIEDFDGQLKTFSQWLYKIEQDLNYLEDYCLKSDDTNSNKQTVIELYQELQKEIDNQNGAYSNLSHTSNKILDSFKDKTEKETLQLQLDEINKRWSLLRKKSLEIRGRLESNSAQWSALLGSLKELIQWCKSQQQQIVIKKQSLQPDLNITNKQINENKVFMCNIEYKKSIIESTLASAKLYYDDRVRNIETTSREAASVTFSPTNQTIDDSTSSSIPTSAANSQPQSSGLIMSSLKRKLSSKKSKKEKKSSLQELKIKEENENENADTEHDVSKLQRETTSEMKSSKQKHLQENDDDELMEDDVFEEDADLIAAKGELGPAEIAVHLINKIDRKVQLLDKLWQELNRQSLNYNNILMNFYQNLQLIHKSFELVGQKLNEKEQAVSRISLVNEIESDKLAEELEKIKNFQLMLSSYQPLIDEMCTHYLNINQELQHCASFKNNNSLFNAKFEDLNLRWSNLQNQLQEKYLHMYSLVESSGANIFIKLSESVQMPWQRGISATNKVPYYINHASEMTSWDHPKMIDLYKSFTNLNDIRFSAYRTAMKLRTLQKRLWLDFVDINDAIEAFEPHKQNEKNLDTIQVIQCLNKLFQPAYKQNIQLIDIVLAVDLTLNWLLSVYDPSRCGQIRVLSMKIAIVLLCKGSIEDKYIHIFNLIADNNDTCNHRKLGLLLYDMIMIPKQLGEVAAFGGSNIEPSVRSCFEYVSAKVSSEINLNHFLEWLKLEPQSIVWLPVLHRLAAAETARHDAKCSICKEYPIVGFRYRSLKHFNFDVCQSCFFSGRKIKGFKFDHPLLEYYTPTSSSDDIKDFFRIFRNKFRSKRARRSSKLGYLPVQSVLEGDEFENLLKNFNSLPLSSSVDSQLQAQTPKHVVVNPPSEEIQAQQTLMTQQAQLVLQAQQKQQQQELQQQHKMLQKQKQREEEELKVQQEQLQKLQNLQLHQKLLQQQQQQQQLHFQQQNQNTLQSRAKSKSKSPGRQMQQHAICPSLSKIETNIISRSTHKVFINEPVNQPKTTSNIKINESDDEHKLIAQFCSSLNGETVKNLSKTGVILESTPSQVNNAINEAELDQQQELENIINDLEEENMFLMEEYTRLQNQLNSSTATSAVHKNKNMFSINKIKTSTLQHTSNQQYASDLSQAYHTISSSSRALSSSPTILNQQTVPGSNSHYYTSSGSLNTKNGNLSYNKVPTLFASVNSSAAAKSNKYSNGNKETNMLAEARLLRQHEDRLEARMKILENHNRLLDSQLKQLRTLLNNNTSQSKEAPKFTNISAGNNSLSKKLVDIQLDQKSSERITTNNNNPSCANIGALFHNVEDITRAINNLNNLVNSISSADNS